MIIAIDFDGTIVDHKYPFIGTLKPGAKETINRWYVEGHKIIIWSCRTEEETVLKAKEFLKENDVNYHTFNENIESDDGFDPYPKIFAHLYIDDRGLRFDDLNMNWGHLNNLIK